MELLRNVRMPINTVIHTISICWHNSDGAKTDLVPKRRLQNVCSTLPPLLVIHTSSLLTRFVCDRRGRERHVAESDIGYRTAGHVQRELRCEWRPAIEIRHNAGQHDLRWRGHRRRGRVSGALTNNSIGSPPVSDALVTGRENNRVTLVPCVDGRGQYLLIYVQYRPTHIWDIRVFKCDN